LYAAQASLVLAAAPFGVHEAPGVEPSPEESMQRIIVGMTGATGAILGVRVLEALRAAGVETHLVLSKWAQRTLEHEAGMALKDVRALASAVHGDADMGAAISSGSFLTNGMVIVPCSMRTLAVIAHGTGENLVHRAADVVLKERRRLVLVARETPLSDVHLENMLKLSRSGVVVMPPVPAFYNHPRTIDDVIGHIVARVLDQFGVDGTYAGRWDGRLQARAPSQ
jgi:flavin prenyltransferase